MIFSLLLEGNPFKNIRFLSNFHRAKFAKFALLSFVAVEANLTDIFTRFSKPAYRAAFKFAPFKPKTQI